MWTCDDEHPSDPRRRDPSWRPCFRCARLGNSCHHWNRARSAKPDVRWAWRRPLSKSGSPTPARSCNSVAWEPKAPDGSAKPRACRRKDSPRSATTNRPRACGSNPSPAGRCGGRRGSARPAKNRRPQAVVRRDWARPWTSRRSPISRPPRPDGCGWVPTWSTLEARASGSSTRCRWTTASCGWPPTEASGRADSSPVASIRARRAWPNLAPTGSPPIRRAPSGCRAAKDRSPRWSTKSLGPPSSLPTRAIRNLPRLASWVQPRTAASGFR